VVRACFFRRELQEKLNPPIYGWHNVRCPNFVAQEHIVFRTGAAKYEAGTHNLLGLIGLIAAMELVAEIGIENIAAELLRKRARLVPALQAKGFTVLNADAKIENASGIISFYQAGSSLAEAASAAKVGKDLTALHKKLTDAGIVTSLRADRKGQSYIRFSPHFYNTDAELQRTLELL
jgi:selenocysteine lyase/cysteine desulfurase